MSDDGSKKTESRPIAFNDLLFIKKLHTTEDDKVWNN